MREKLLQVCKEYDHLNELMATNEIASNPDLYRKHAKSQKDISALVHRFNAFLKDESDLESAESLLRDETDADIREMAEEERKEISVKVDEHEQELKVLLLPKDPNDAKNTIVEIRAGTGGDEAALFCADLFKAYSRFAEIKGWKVEILNTHETGIGGYKEISFKISGDNVFSQFKFEGGVHRVQRVPETETQGRVHTSAITVAVLPEAEEVELEISPADLQIDVYRSSGPGGQSVNTTDSAVRITHKPSGTIVTCQDEKSQHKNKAKAMLILRSRILSELEHQEASKRSADRKSQVGSGDRSERIRTYNFPQNRLSDHRIGLTLYRLEQVMQGEMQEIVNALIAADRAAKMAIKPADEDSNSN
ncbi:MAG TPA: peptide chain release factor 1 [Candidatus Hydrogenedentes bacterium]|nr:peptide chain release factor 1 [Candidatus Hydrogenedentota bacterium]HIB54145.1 peptide chain release factor 1 [Nitrospirales bacterium]